MALIARNELHLHLRLELFSPIPRAVFHWLKVDKELLPDLNTFLLVLFVKSELAYLLLEWRAEPRLAIDKAYVFLLIRFLSDMSMPLLLAFFHQVFLISLAKRDIQLEELLFGHLVEKMEDGQVNRYVEFISSKNLLPCMSLQAHLLSVETIALE